MTISREAMHDYASMCVGSNEDAKKYYEVFEYGKCG